jgi:tetratricopeptide (TPR) repeat protein
MAQGTVLENGGTESGTIRKIVWQGAGQVWQHYPIFGSGLETFAYSYYLFRPIPHNITSEWDFIYNKAHNEFLNYLANTGILGFSSYISLIIYSVIIFIKSKRFDLLSGYVAILVTNFFGFSVVPVSLLFFLFPAMAIVTSDERLEISKKLKISINQWILISLVLVTNLYTLFSIYSYWQADTYYKKAKDQNRLKNFEEAKIQIDKALYISSNEPIYLAESSFANSEITLKKAQESKVDEAQKYAEKAIKDGINATILSPKNIYLQRTLSSTYYKFSVFGSQYQMIAEEPLSNAISISPNDPKLHYLLGILNLKNNKIEDGLKNLQTAVDLKSNYKEGRFALGLTYLDIKKYDKAVENLEYIINNIDPNDELTKKYIEQAKSASK